MRGSLYGAEDIDVAEESGFTVLTTDELRDLGAESLRQARPRYRRRPGRWFISFDIDFLDPAFAPGTGTPEVGGLLDGGSPRVPARAARRAACAAATSSRSRLRTTDREMQRRLRPRTSSTTCCRFVRSAASGGAHVSWLGDSASLACLTFDVDAEAPILVESVSTRGSRRDVASGLRPARRGAADPRPAARVLAARDFFVPGWTADRYPQVVEAILKAGHEIGHHSYAHRSPFVITEDEERADFERALESLRALGVEPKGFRCPSWEPGGGRRQIVAEYGLEYDSSLMDSDRPYVLDTGAGEIVELPVHWSLDDWEQYAYLPRAAVRSRSRRRRRCSSSGRASSTRCAATAVCMSSPVIRSSPGGPHRVEVLRALIERAIAVGDVEFVEAAQRRRAAHARTRRRAKVADAGHRRPGALPDR